MRFMILFFHHFLLEHSYSLLESHTFWEDIVAMSTRSTVFSTSFHIASTFFSETSTAFMFTIHTICSIFRAYFATVSFISSMMTMIFFIISMRFMIFFFHHFLLEHSYSFLESHTFWEDMVAMCTRSTVFSTSFHIA